MNEEGLAFAERYFCDEFRDCGANDKPLLQNSISVKSINPLNPRSRSVKKILTQEERNSNYNSKTDYAVAFATNRIALVAIRRTTINTEVVPRSTTQGSSMFLTTY